MSRIILLTPLLVLLLSCSLVEQCTGCDERPPDPHVGGLISLEELIAARDTIVRATMTATSSEIVLYPDPIYDPPTIRFWVLGQKYWVLRRFDFTVIEYLKGSGPASLTAVWAHGETYDTKSAAEESQASILSAVDASWENTTDEAVLFLSSGSGEPNDASLEQLLGQGDDYFLGWAYYGDDDGYSLHSDVIRVWLPQLPSVATEYLLAPPPIDDIITLAELKQKIADIGAELAVNTSDYYRECVLLKYGELRRARNWPAETGHQYSMWPNPVPTIESGTPAGAEVALRAFGPGYPGETSIASGADADLFSLATSTGPDSVFSERITTARPLVPGEYTFRVKDNWKDLKLCGYMDSTDFTVTVEDDGSQHSFFFDPVANGSAVAADSFLGVLKPRRFTNASGVRATINRLEYVSSTVSLSFTPLDGLSGHRLEFVGLDGAVSLALAVDDAMRDTPSGVLRWTVSEAPFADGDRLMVRIRKD